MVEGSQQTAIPAAPALSNKSEEQTLASSDASQKLVLLNKSQMGLEQYPMTVAMQQAADTGIFRNQGAQVFLKALCQLRETDLKDARIERQTALDDANLQRDNYHAENTKRAVLEERLCGEISLRRMQAILISFGGVFLGSGLQPLFVSFSAGFLVLSIVGLAMMLVGWFYQGPSGKKQL